MRIERSFRVTVIAFLLAVLLPPSRGAAASPVVIDGEFAEWSGKAHLEDTFDDTKHHWDDVRYWYWATNNGESAIYFMVERFSHHYDGSDSEETLERVTPDIPDSGNVPYPELEELIKEFGAGKGGINGKSSIKEKKEAHYTIFVDADNNGEFGDVGDGVIYADYYPEYLGFTGVSVFVRIGHTWKRVIYWGFWGEDASEGGLRCEFPVPFSAISIEPGQSLRLVLFAQDRRTDFLYPEPAGEYERLVDRREADRVPDMGDLQWAPVSALGRFGWVALLMAGAMMPAITKLRRGRCGGPSQ